MPSTQTPAGRRPIHGSPASAALTALFDLVAPIALYYGLRAGGTDILLALIVGAVPPILSATVKAIKHRRVDGLALVVVIMLAASAGTSLINGSPRFLLAKDGLLTTAWGAWFFLSLYAERPLAFRFARPLLEGRKVFDPKTRRWVAPTGYSWDDLWEQAPRFSRMWRVSTMIWGTALLLDAALKVVMAYALPMDIVPGLGAALWLVTFLALQVITNVHLMGSGLWLILLGGPDPTPHPNTPTDSARI